MLVFVLEHKFFGSSQDAEIQMQREGMSIGIKIYIFVDSFEDKFDLSYC